MTPLILLIALSILIIVHEAGHFVVARRCGVRVERFSIGFGPVLLRWRRGETDYAISAFPLGGYVKMAGEQGDGRTGARWEYGSQPVWRRAGIVLAGPLVNYATGILLFTFLFWAGSPTLMPTIGGVLEGYPAAAAGLRPGDRIVAVAGAPVESWEQVTARIRRQTSGAPVVLLIQREGAEQAITVTPTVRTGTRTAVVGLTPSDEVRIVRAPLPEAAVRGVGRAWDLTVMTGVSLWQMVTGALPLKESLTGPVGIFYITSSAAALGWRYLVQLFAVLSVSLAIFNLLPLPVLDGGHLAFLLIERIRRRPVSLKIQEVATQAGMVFLIGMLLVVTYHDLSRFQLVSRLTGLFK
ncbi:MAG: RIP metalloprotease RseP [Omnitrophica WOR_2 bacterium RIFCSPHIGHO2_02_FULL_68_15]|nr:MAG: RIP metalloprotease RseP [Omnitrophica WOR_2 bacterium RIFCSPHIGHO2_02_FULL_68_15]